MPGSRGGTGFWKLGCACAALLAGGGALSVATTSSAASSYASVITGGQTITPGQQLQSADGHYELIMLSTGDLDEYATVSGRLIWSSGTSGSNNEAVLEPTGQLVVDSPAGTQLWSDNATTTGCPALNVLDDGNVEVEGPSSAAWSTGTVSVLDGGDSLEPGQGITGQEIFSPNEDYELVMQGDGNLVLYNSSMTALWASNTAGNPGAYANLSTGGDFAVYPAGGGTALWHTNTPNNANDYLYLQPDGNLVLYPAGDGASTGGAIWSSATSTGEGSPGPGSGDIAPTPQYGSGTACSSPASSGSTTSSAPTSTVVSVTSTPPASSPTSGSNPASSPATGRAHKLAPLLNVPLSFHWSWRGADSYLSTLTFGRLPPGLRWTATITPAKPGAKASTDTARNAKQRHKLLLWLEHHRYTTGETVKLEIQRTGFRAETVTFRMRLHKVPAIVTSKRVAVKKKTTKKK